ncbi:hypothetical protein Tco_0139892 [Tanacetum coccineum]
MNGKNPLALDFKTFTTSTGLGYNNGEYVAHPYPEAVKAELAKIVTNPCYLEKTPILKNSFTVAWRILFTFVIQGAEASGALFKKRQKLKSKKTPTKTQVTPPTVPTPPIGPTKGYEQSHLVSPSNVPDPQDPERNIQLAGTVKTTPLPKGPHGDKDSEEFKPLADMEPLTTLTSSEVEPDSETLQLTTFADVQALLLFDDEMVQESDEDDVLEAGEEMNDDIPPKEA